MANESFRIMPGAKGWLHEAWENDFYPDDLPAEWQLGYYSNEFPVVMFPADYWEQDDEMIGSWLEDSGEHLQLVCEFDSFAQWQSQHKRLSLFDGQCCGIVCHMRQEQINPAELDEMMAAGMPVCLDVGDDTAQISTVSEMADIRDRNINIVWHGGEQQPVASDARLVMASVTDTGQMDMRELRRLIETLLSVTTAEQTVVLIFAGQPAHVETMRNMVTMLDLF